MAKILPNVFVMNLTFIVVEETRKFILVHETLERVSCIPMIYFFFSLSMRNTFHILCITKSDEKKIISLDIKHNKCNAVA